MTREEAIARMQANDTKIANLEARDAGSKSTMADALHGTFPWLTQSAVGTSYGLGGLGDLAMKATEKVGKALGTGYEAQPGGQLPVARPGENLTNAARTMQFVGDINTPEAHLKDLAKRYPSQDLTYQPQSRVGEYEQGALGIAPQAALSAVSGGASMLPAVVRSIPAAIGATEMGHLAKNYLPESWQSWADPVARTIGAVGGYGFPSVVQGKVSPNTATPARTAQVERVREAAGPEARDAAQATGSEKLRGKMGPAPASQDTAVSNALLKSARYEPYNPANPEKMTLRNHILKQTENLSNEGKQIAKNPLQADDQLEQKLRERVSNYENSGAEDAPAVRAQYDRLYGFDSRYPRDPNGHPTLTGEQYWQLRNDWTAKNHPIIRGMINDVDDAMGRSNPQAAAAWEDWRDRYGAGEAFRNQAKNSKELNAIDPKGVFEDVLRPSATKKLAEDAMETKGPTEGKTNQLSTGLPYLLGAGATYLAHQYGHMPLAMDAPVIAGLSAKDAVPWLMNKGGPATAGALQGYRELNFWPRTDQATTPAGQFAAQVGQKMDPQTAAKLLYNTPEQQQSQ